MAERCCKLAYQRGYHAGSRRAWPRHKPPIPPDEIVGALVRSSRDVRDALDSFLQTFDPDDEPEYVTRSIESFDQTQRALSEWLVEVEGRG